MEVAGGGHEKYRMEESIDKKRHNAQFSFVVLYV